MSGAASLLQRALGVFRSRGIESELRAEFDAHIEMRTELLVQRGVPPDAARREAMRQFGNRAWIRGRPSTHKPSRVGVMQLPTA